MSTSKRSQEGYIMLDHRQSPALPDEITKTLGDDLPLNAGKGLFEAPTYTCSHCQVVVILNPLRSRERVYCNKCDHYICDTCGVTKAQTGECKTFNQIIEEIQEYLIKNMV